MDIQKVANYLRWAARITGTLMGLFAIYFGGAHLFEDANPDIPPAEAIQGAFAVGLLVVSGLGLLLAWKWERRGGAINLIAIVGFYILTYVSTGQFLIGLLLPVMAFPGLLFILVGWHKHYQTESEAAPPEPSE